MYATLMSVKPWSFNRCNDGNEQVFCDELLSALSDHNDTTVLWGSLKGAGDDWLEC